MHNNENLFRGFLCPESCKYLSLHIPMCTFVALGANIRMPPWPPTFMIMRRHDFDVTLKMSLSRGWLKCKKGRRRMTCLMWIQPHTQERLCWRSQETCPTSWIQPNSELLEIQSNSEFQNLNSNPTQSSVSPCLQIDVQDAYKLWIGRSTHARKEEEI
jgi:hypothetical protein